MRRRAAGLYYTTDTIAVLRVLRPQIMVVCHPLCKKDKDCAETNMITVLQKDIQLIDQSWVDQSEKEEEIQDVVKKQNQKDPGLLLP